MDTTFFPCRTTFVTKINKLAAISLYPSVGVCFALIPFVLLYEIITIKHTIPQLIYLSISTICIIFISIFMFYLAKTCYCFESRYIALDQYGFMIKYGKNGKQERYVWDEVCDIGIVIYAATASKQAFQTQICIFLEPFDNVTLRKLRDSDIYGPFHLDRFILLDYTPSAIEKIESATNLCIHDYREKQMKI